MDNIVETKNLKTYFKVAAGTLHAVDDVTLAIPRGSTLGIVGESGCGKSTLGRTILGLTPSVSGSVLFEGREITNLSKRESWKLRMRMQMIFQDPYSSLDPRMSITQIIEEPLKIYGVCKSKAEREKLVSELMDTVGIARRFANSYPHELDGGRRQRIGIARALALNPDFIVCDEPVSALDVSIQAQVLNLLQDLQQERKLTYMFITHDLSVVRHISDHICVMYLGRVVESCEAKELFRNPVHPYTKALLSAIPIPSAHLTEEPIPLRGEVTSPIDPPACCRFAARCEYAAERCFREEPQPTPCGEGHFCACFLTEERARTGE